MYLFRKIALTGATSTLGIAIINECIRNDIEVLAFVNPESKNKNRIPINSRIKIIPCALEEQNKIDITGLTAEVFVHLAWQSSNRLVRNNLIPQIENIRYSVDSVTLAEKLGCFTWVGAGSQAEYGKANVRLTENTYPAPVTAYGMAKLCAGQMTRLECDKYKIKHIWPRILSTYGPNTQDTTILNYTIRSLLEGKSPNLTRCEQMWDFLYVDDAARALLLLADKGKNGETYIVSSGKACAMKQYIEIIKDKINVDIHIGYGKIPYDENSIMYLEGDISKIKKEVGFEPTIIFEDGIDKTIAWAKNYYV